MYGTAMLRMGRVSLNSHVRVCSNWYSSPDWCKPKKKKSIKFNPIGVYSGVTIFQLTSHHFNALEKFIGVNIAGLWYKYWTYSQWCQKQIDFYVFATALNGCEVFDVFLQQHFVVVCCRWQANDFDFPYLIRITIITMMNTSYFCLSSTNPSLSLANWNGFKLSVSLRLFRVFIFSLFVSG